MKKIIKEKEVIDVFREFIKTNYPYAYVEKIHVTPMHGKGFPDLVVIVDTATLFVEAKAPGKKPTENQLATLNFMNRAGGNTFILDCDPKNKKVLNFYDHEHKFLLSVDTTTSDLESFRKLLK